MPGATNNYVGNLGTTGENYASDSIGSVHYPRVKITWGVEDTATDVSATNPLPIIDLDSSSSGTITAADAVVAAPAGDGTARTGASTAASYFALACPGGDSAWAMQLTGTFGGATVYYEESVDSTNGLDGNWYAVNGRQTGVVNTVLGYSTTVAGFFRGNTSGVTWLRARAVGGAAISISVRLRISSGSGAIFLNASIPTGTNSIGTTPGPALTKAVQGTVGHSVQDLKDAGRVAKQITLDSFAVAATAETLMTMSYSQDNATLTTGTSYSVTAGKRLRVQSISAFIHTIAGNTTAVAVIVRIRVNNGGAGIVSSPVQMVFAIQGVAAANQAGIPVVIPIPDGWELVAGAGLAVTVACPGFVATTAAPKVDIAINAFEY